MYNIPELNEQLSSQYKRTKIKKEISTLSKSEKTDLMLRCYYGMMPLTRIYSLFNCKPEHVLLVLSHLDIKRCSKCHNICGRSEFHKQSKGSYDGLSSFCRKCALEYTKRPDALTIERLKSCNDEQII